MFSSVCMCVYVSEDSGNTQLSLLLNIENLFAIVRRAENLIEFNQQQANL
jgi:hypothetical protein